MNLNRGVFTAFLGTIVPICLIMLLGSSFSYAVVSPNSVEVIYQYPVAGSREVPVGTGIGIRAGSGYDAERLSEGSFIAVGSISGEHVLTVRLSRDRRTAVFHTAIPYAYGEIVRFAMIARLAGGAMVSDTFSFTTMIRAPAPIPDWVLNERSRMNKNTQSMRPLDTSYNLFPTLSVTVDSGATPGTIYMCNEGFTFVPNDFYLFLLDEHGNVTKQNVLPNDYAQDFELQPSGIRTYYDEERAVFFGMDSNWNIIDTFQAENYTTDSHELRFLPDGSYALFGLSESYVDMSSYVAGGYDSTIAFGSVIQIFDPDGLLIFQWRGIDNFQIQDAKFEDLTSSIIDFQHANSLDFDSSGNIIMSSRHLCEITKINAETGEIIWRLGGHHNQFKLLDDSIWFSYQHCVRLLTNGHLIFMDNADFDTVVGGNGAYIEQSRPVEYELDTSAMTAKLVWQYHHNPETFTDAMGNVERLPNGNTFIGWGADTLAITEIRPDNSTAFEMNMSNGNYSYRAIKYPTDTSSANESVPIAASQSASPSLSIVENTVTNTPAAIVTLATPAIASLELYDVLGREAKSINNSILSAGNHTFPLDISGLLSGSYYCVLNIEGGQVITKSVEILK